MFEHHQKPLITRKGFVSRQLRYVSFSSVILISSIGIGTAGYHFFEGLPWIDSFLNAAMILTGMGPVDHLDTKAGKMFAACLCFANLYNFLRSTLPVLFIKDDGFIGFSRVKLMI